jgi:hypothetical protein
MSMNDAGRDSAVDRTTRARVGQDFQSDDKNVRNGNADLLIPSPLFLSISPTFLHGSSDD